MESRPNYHLWGCSRGSWCAFELEVTSPTAMRSLYPEDWDGRHRQSATAHYEWRVFSSTMATPCPDPMQTPMTPYRTLRSRSSVASVRT
jgi:hypothetical protein